MGLRYHRNRFIPRIKPTVTSTSDQTARLCFTTERATKTYRKQQHGWSNITITLIRHGTRGAVWAQRGASSGFRSTCPSASANKQKRPSVPGDTSKRGTNDSFSPTGMQRGRHTQLNWKRLRWKRSGALRRPRKRCMCLKAMTTIRPATVGLACFGHLFVADEVAQLTSYSRIQHRCNAQHHWYDMIRKPWDYSSVCVFVFPQGQVFGMEGTEILN